MKINIESDEFNRLIADEKYEILEWLTCKGCRTNSKAYIYPKNKKALDWLYTNNVPLNKKDVLVDVLERYINEKDMIMWFINKKCIVSPEAVNKLIDIGNLEYISWCIDNIKLQFKYENIVNIIRKGDIKLLDFLESNFIKIECDKNMEDIIFSTKDKYIIKWFIKRDYLE